MTDDWMTVDLDHYPHLVVAFPSLRHRALPKEDMYRNHLGHDRVQKAEFLNTLMTKEGLDEGKAEMLFKHYANADADNLRMQIRSMNPGHTNAVLKLFSDLEATGNEMKHTLDWPKDDDWDLKVEKLVGP